MRLPCPRISNPLRDWVIFWANRVSFGELELLMEQVSGAAGMSEDAIWRLIQSEALRLDTCQLDAISQSADQPEPNYIAGERVYERDAPEFVVMTDGIGVKAQKPTRERTGQPKTPKVEKRHDTDVLIMPRPNGAEQIVCEGTSGRWNLVDAARAYLRREWSGTTLHVVALTDGARNIRGDLAALFGDAVRIILDWYHLEKRVYQQLSRSANSMIQREQWQQKVLALLWRGRVLAAKSFLNSLPARNPKPLEDLVTYLDKHAHEIVDYQRRQEAGKVIGTGRMEKCVDQVVGMRQKGKGMSWSREGSRALAIIKTAELNARHATA